MVSMSVKPKRLSSNSSLKKQKSTASQNKTPVLPKKTAKLDSFSYADFLPNEKPSKVKNSPSKEVKKQETKINKNDNTKTEKRSSSKTTREKSGKDLKTAKLSIVKNGTKKNGKVSTKTEAGRGSASATKKQSTKKTIASKSSTISKTSGIKASEGIKKRGESSSKIKASGEKAGVKTTNNKQGSAKKSVIRAEASISAKKVQIKSGIKGSNSSLSSAKSKAKVQVKKRVEKI
jgi:hypothetical protein